MCNEVFRLFTNLTHLELDGDHSYALSRPLIGRGLQMTFSPTTIVHLCIRMQNIDDCLYLLDGRLSQLQSLIIHLDYIHDPVLLRRDATKFTSRSWKIMDSLVNIPIRRKNAFIAYDILSVMVVFDGLNCTAEMKIKENDHWNGSVRHEVSYRQTPH